MQRGRQTGTLQRSFPRCVAHRGDRLCTWCVAHRWDHLRSMLHTAEIISTVCCTPQRSSLWCGAHGGDHFCGVLHTAEIISTVCCTPRRSFLRCVAHHRDRLCGVLHTAEIISTVCFTLQRSSPRCVAHRWDHLCGVHKDHQIIINRVPNGLELWKKLEVKNLVTHSLKLKDFKYSPAYSTVSTVHSKVQECKINALIKVTRIHVKLDTK